MTYTLNLSDADIMVIGAALGEVRFKDAAPVVEKINRQLDAQNAANKAAADTTKDEGKAP